MKRLFLLLTSLILLLFFLILAGLEYCLTQPNYHQSEKIKFIVTKGDTINQIAHRLYQKKLIYQPFIFKFAVKQAGVAHQIKAGSFSFDGKLSPMMLAKKLTEKPEDTWIRILEGWRREEIANYLERQPLTAFDKKEFLRLTRDKEGYLFPDTYLVAKETTTKALVNLLLNTFDQKVKRGLAQTITASPHSLKEAIIVASLLEREAKGETQMRHVAGIIYNRLDIGMPLQIDATLQYAQGWSQRKQSYWSSPSAALKRIDSPYNTYRQVGLPPQPIANPGLLAIKAALDPLKTKDLYYLHAPDGHIYYARTLAGHNRHIARYLH